MYDIVHVHEPTTGRGEVVVAVPAIDEDSGVVVVVQEDELLFAQDNKHGVDKLRQFAHDEHVDPESVDAVAAVIRADRVDETAIKD